jgi:serine/threonine protein kinase
VTSAIAYLHKNNIRHKDIKPSNVLLSLDGIWLTDFGAAKNFTDDLTSSSEGRERGTLKYCASEVAHYEQSGRLADMFSLGCLFLETQVILFTGHLLEKLGELRPAKNRSYEANLDKPEQWLGLIERHNHQAEGLVMATKQMLDHDRKTRLTAKSLVLLLAGLDGGTGHLHCQRCSQ